MAYMGHVIVQGYVACDRPGCGHDRRWHSPCTTRGCTCDAWLAPALQARVVPAQARAAALTDDVAAAAVPVHPVVRAYDRCVRSTCGHERRWHAPCTRRNIPDGPVCGCPAFVASMTLDVLDYLFSDTTTAPPGAGQLRMNKVDQRAATLLWLDDMTAPGVDVYRLVLLAREGDTVDVQDKDDHTRWQQYVVTGAVGDHGTYVALPVVWRAGAGVLQAQRVLATLARAGQPGLPG